jgi:hypothetical protein
MALLYWYFRTIHNDSSFTKAALPILPSESIFVDRTSPMMMDSMTAGSSSSSSKTYDRNFVESNENDDHDHCGTITVEATLISRKANAFYKETGATSSRQVLESKIRANAPPKRCKRSFKGNCSSLQRPSTEASTKSASDSESNHEPKCLDHDLTKKRYRSRLKNQFENFLSALPASLIAECDGSAGGGEDRREKRISKAEVLILTKGHIGWLEMRQADLEEENRALAEGIRRMEDVWVRKGGSTLMP